MDKIWIKSILVFDIKDKNIMSCDILINMLKSRIKFERKKNNNKEKYSVNTKTVKFVDEIRENGYCVIENYLSSDFCKLLRGEIDSLIGKYKNTDTVLIDEEGSDHRIFGSERFSNNINRFYSDKFLLDVAQKYFDGKIWNSNTLAARIDYKKGNLGSGGGWHRDSHHFQFKAIVYLSDVEIDNGPFQIIKGSHGKDQSILDMNYMGIDSLTTRYTDEQINKIIEQRPNDYNILTAKAGTLIFADTSALHTGLILKNGSRYALFNYYYPSYQNKEDIINKFSLNKELS